jgi:hypothetical protein
MTRAYIRSVLTAAVLILVNAVAVAQSLGVTEKKAVIDGVITSGEYAYTQDFGQVTVYLQRTSDTLFIGVVGKTSGWVAVGLNSRRMDSASIFMGFAQNGKAQFTAQAGTGHSHQEAIAATAATVLSSAVKEDGGKTVLEIALKAAPYIAKDQKELDVIFSIAAAKDFTQKHSFRGSAKVPLT